LASTAIGIDTLPQHAARDDEGKKVFLKVRRIHQSRTVECKAAHAARRCWVDGEETVSRLQVGVDLKKGANAGVRTSSAIM